MEWAYAIEVKVNRPLTEEQKNRLEARMTGALKDVLGNPKGGTFLVCSEEGNTQPLRIVIEI